MPGSNTTALFRAHQAHVEEVSGYGQGGTLGFQPLFTAGFGGQSEEEKR